jgi:uncharacterized protein
VGKLLIWVVILTLAYIAWRVYVGKQDKAARRAASDADGDRDGQPGGSGPPGRDKAGRLVPPEAMRQCNVCGLHLPGSEALYARGRVYCSAEHRASDPDARDARDDRG